MPIIRKLRARENQLQVLFSQMSSYQVSALKPPQFEKLQDDPQEQRKVLKKFTKGNLKLNIPLEMSQAVGLCEHFLS